ncbi:MAG: hypothetical protein WDM86_03055 [Rhizomicrobium sp.]
MVNAAAITTPTLFIACENGVNDPALEWLYVVSQKLNVDSQYLFYRGEPHSIAKPENIADLMGRIIGWFGQHDNRH